MTPQDLANLAVQVSGLYVIPYVATLVVALITVSFAMSASGKRTKSLVKSILKAEIRTNIEISKSILAYSLQQLTSDATVQPMPHYHETAFLEYKRAGLLDRLPRSSAEELVNVYIYIESVNEAGRRQEDLAFGPSAAYPNSHELRIQNLTYIQDTIHNVLAPYQGRLPRMKI
jgi:hypothetical protein